ncbi:hypothetical protein HDV05_005230 [Chytridiales sp. JEL 0842]|nr:hypothetical protein HDV05_005230 [Chytridiales sp. JEL 0842]
MHSTPILASLLLLASTASYAAPLPQDSSSTIIASTTTTTTTTLAASPTPSVSTNSTNLPSCRFRSSDESNSGFGVEDYKPCVVTPETVGYNSFFLRGSQIYDANNQLFVHRGINHPYSWFRYSQDQEQAFKQIKNVTQSNSIRIVLQTSDDAASVKNAIELARKNKMVAVLENHDGTGFGEKPGAKSMAQIVDWWISVKSAMDGTENVAILNIANEPIGNDNFLQWIGATQNAVKRLRDAGFKHQIMVDAPNWGQDWSGTMRDNAVQVFESDPHRNLIFSPHMYGQYGTPQKVKSYIDSFLSRNLPIVIGEFGFDHGDGDVDEETIFSYSNEKNVGWLAWSWSGNGADVKYLDMVNNFDPSQPTAWGKQVFERLKGAKELSIFSEAN